MYTILVIILHIIYTLYTPENDIRVIVVQRVRYRASGVCTCVRKVLKLEVSNLRRSDKPQNIFELHFARS